MLAQWNATTYGERIKNEIAAGIEITDALEQILISEDGEIHQFSMNSMSCESFFTLLVFKFLIFTIWPKMNDFSNCSEAGKIS